MHYAPISERMVTTRKPHQCPWCGELIYNGGRAMSRAYTLDDDFQHDHMHPECWAALPFADLYDNTFEEFEHARGMTMERVTA